MFGALSPFHWLIIGMVALLLFGNRLPDVARSIGRSIQEFKKGLRDVRDDIEDEMKDDEPREKLDPPDDDRESDETVSRAHDRDRAREPEHHTSDDK